MMDATSDGALFFWVEIKFITLKSIEKLERYKNVLNKNKNQIKNILVPW